MKLPSATLVVVGALALSAVLIAAALTSSRAQEGEPLEIFCAAGLKKPAEQLATLAASQARLQVQLQFGGSGDLLTRITVAQRGDLFIPADRSYLDLAVQKGLVREIIPLAVQQPVLAVRKGNPLGIRSLSDAIARSEVRLGLANPESASIGALAKRVLSESGTWDSLRTRLAVTKPTVMEVASDLSLGTIDAAIVWDATVRQIAGLETVELGPLGQRQETIAAGVLNSSQHPRAALRFARLASSPELGNPVFNAAGYSAIPGDTWAEEPSVLVYSGAVNRTAVDPLLKAFAEREGVRIDTVYNGCGILCASMQSIKKNGAGALPDAYYACDVCFVPPVAEHFPEAVLLTEADIVIAVPKGNPQGVSSLIDLGRKGMKVGICNAEQSTLGFMTQRMLKRLNLEEGLMRNVVSQVPTGDLLVNQLRTGSLDAAIVYRVNVHGRSDVFDTVPILINGLPSRSVQPFAVRKDSQYRLLMQRLLASMQAHPEAFTKAGFTWRPDQQAVDSEQLPIPDYLKGAGGEL